MICDALNDIVWLDDRLIVDGAVKERYSKTGKGYIEIEVRPWGQDEFQGSQLDLVETCNREAPMD